MNLNKSAELLLPGSELNVLKQQNTLQGRYRGYWLVLEPGIGSASRPAGTFRVTVNVSLSDDQTIQQLDRFLTELVTEWKQVVTAKRVAHSVVIEMRATLNRKQIENVINPVTDQLIRWLETQRLSSGCSYCGSTTAQLSSYTINGNTHYLCDECAAKVEANLKGSQQEIQSHSSQLIPGLAGAMLGGLLGIALWFGIYQLGYIAAVAGLVLAAASCKGYELLGKYLDRKGIIVCSIVVLVFTFLSVKLCWSYELYKALEGDWDFGSCFRNLNSVLDEFDLKGDYIGEMVKGYLFTILGAAGTIAQNLKSANGSYSFKKN